MICDLSAHPFSLTVSLDGCQESEIPSLVGLPGSSGHLPNSFSSHPPVGHGTTACFLKSPFHSHGHWQASSHNALGHEPHLPLWSVVPGFFPSRWQTPSMCASHPQCSEGRQGALRRGPSSPPQLRPFPTPYRAPFHAADLF